MNIFSLRKSMNKQTNEMKRKRRGKENSMQDDGNYFQKKNKQTNFFQVHGRLYLYKLIKDFKNEDSSNTATEKLK